MFIKYEHRINEGWGKSLLCKHFLEDKGILGGFVSNMLFVCIIIIYIKVSYQVRVL